MYYHTTETSPIPKKKKAHLFTATAQTAGKKIKKKSEARSRLLSCKKLDSATHFTYVLQHPNPSPQLGADGPDSTVTCSERHTTFYIHPSKPPHVLLHSSQPQVFRNRKFLPVCSLGCVVLDGLVRGAGGSPERRPECARQGGRAAGSLSAVEPLDQIQLGFLTQGQLHLFLHQFLHAYTQSFIHLLMVIDSP
jgi:hypothetical protein